MWRSGLKASSTSLRTSDVVAGGVALVLTCGVCALAMRRYLRSKRARKRLQELLAAVAGEDARVVLTGADSGIGAELATEFATHPKVSLLLAVRGAERQDGERKQVVPLELLDFGSVQRFAKEAHDFLAKGGDGLRLLVNNAGVMAPPEDGSGSAGVSPTWQTNFLGPFLLTELICRFRENARVTRPLRVVLVSSSKEGGSMLDESSIDSIALGERAQSLSEYADSKRALMLWTSVRAQSLAFRGNMYVHATSPGKVDTRLGFYWVPWWLWLLATPIRLLVLRLQSPAEGALAAVAGALRPQATQNFGRYHLGEQQMEDLVIWRMPEKRLAGKLVQWAAKATSLESRVGGRPVGSNERTLSIVDLTAEARKREEDRWSTAERRFARANSPDN